MSLGIRLGLGGLGRRLEDRRIRLDRNGAHPTRLPERVGEHTTLARRRPALPRLRTLAARRGGAGGLVDVERLLLAVHDLDLTVLGIAVVDLLVLVGNLDAVGGRRLHLQRGLVREHGDRTAAADAVGAAPGQRSADTDRHHREAGPDLDEAVAPARSLSAAGPVALVGLGEGGGIGRAVGVHALLDGGEILVEGVRRALGLTLHLPVCRAGRRRIDEGRLDPRRPARLGRTRRGSRRVLRRILLPRLQQGAEGIVLPDDAGELGERVALGGGLRRLRPDRLLRRLTQLPLEGIEIDRRARSVSRHGLILSTAVLGHRISSGAETPKTARPEARTPPKASTRAKRARVDFLSVGLTIRNCGKSLPLFQKL